MEEVRAVVLDMSTKAPEGRSADGGRALQDAIEKRHELPNFEEIGHELSHVADALRGMRSSGIFAS